MKYKAIIAVLFAVFIAGCGNDKSPLSVPVAQASLKCADVSNGTISEVCDPKPVAWYEWLMPTAEAATVIIDGGIVIRNSIQLVHSITDVANPLAVAKTVWIEMRFDAFCAGQAGDWVIVPKQAMTVLPSVTQRFDFGGMCGDMPLGARKMTATVWDTDGITVLGIAIVNFTLI